MTHQPHKLQPPRQMTQDLFEYFRVKKKIVTVFTLSGDTIVGNIVWYDLVGLQLKDSNGFNYYFPRRNIQSIFWK